MDYLHSVIIPPSAPLTVDQSDTGGVGVSDDAEDNTCLVLKKQKVVSMKCDPIQLVETNGSGISSFARILPLRSSGINFHHSEIHKSNMGHFVQGMPGVLISHQNGGSLWTGYQPDASHI